jgi:hypothetical protein
MSGGVHRPPECDSPAVGIVCAAKDGETAAVSYLNQTNQVKVDFVPSWEELYTLRGDTLRQIEPRRKDCCNG